MPKHPSMNLCSTPSRSTYCAARKRTSACAIVTRVVSTSGLSGVGQHHVAHQAVEVRAGGDEWPQRAHGRRIGIELTCGQAALGVGTAEVRGMREQLLDHTRVDPPIDAQANLDVAGSDTRVPGLG